MDTGNYSSPVASLVLTDSSQLTSDSQHLASSNWGMGPTKPPLKLLAGYGLGWMVGKGVGGIQKRMDAKKIKPLWWSVCSVVCSIAICPKYPAGLPQSQSSQTEGELLGQSSQTEGDLLGQSSQTEGELLGQSSQTEGELLGQSSQTEGELLGQSCQTEGDLLGQSSQTVGELQGQSSQTESELLGLSSQTETSLVPDTKASHPDINLKECIETHEFGVLPRSLYASCGPLLLAMTSQEEADKLLVQYALSVLSLSELVVSSPDMDVLLVHTYPPFSVSTIFLTGKGRQKRTSALPKEDTTLVNDPGRTVTHPIIVKPRGNRVGKYKVTDRCWTTKKLMRNKVRRRIEELSDHSILLWTTRATRGRAMPTEDKFASLYSARTDYQKPKQKRKI
uniref:Uncharacterized protein n=1 Tax=Timema tahoe TaxID=61484 RepID=A0A7R9ILI9_9NEOP|nr:unnamed protein product [Timema tahoe]